VFWDENKTNLVAAHHGIFFLDQKCDHFNAKIQGIYCFSSKKVPKK